jgi:hypothetical protein
MSEERERVEEELRRVREGVRGSALVERDPSEILPEPRPARKAETAPTEAEPAAPTPPVPPDGGPINDVWDIRGVPIPRGWRGLAVRALQRLLAPTIEAQVAFNARQTQLDNELLAYLDARFDATHRHYDRVLGLYGRRMDEIDERHRILEEELVAHVHDLVKRIDLVLSEAERNRLSLESALRDVRARLARLEERLKTG